MSVHRPIGETSYILLHHLTLILVSSISLDTGKRSRATFRIRQMHLFKVLGYCVEIMWFT